MDERVNNVVSLVRAVSYKCILGNLLVRFRRQAQKSSNANEEEAPAWAPLRDNYMLANPKLKDWDKKQVSLHSYPQFWNHFASLPEDL